MKGRQGGLALAGLVMGGVLAGALLAESGVRVAAALNPALGRAMHEQDPFATLIEPVGAMGHRQRPGAVFQYRNGTRATTNAQGFRGPEVPTARTPGTLRVLLLGGSTTHGWGVDDTATVDTYMRRLLAERRQRAEVINLGFDGYDALQDLLRYEADGRSFRPDVVIVNSGINDLRNARIRDLQYADPRTLLWTGELARLREEQARGGPRLRTRVKHWSYLYRLVSRVRGNRRDQATYDAGFKLDPNVQAVSNFETSLRRIVELAIEDSALVLLSTPPSSLRSRYAPSATSWHTYWLGDAETTQAWRDSLDVRVRAAAMTQGGAPSWVRYVSHSLGPELFIDDCHLTPAGNAALAADFVAAIDDALSLLPRGLPEIRRASVQSDR